MNRRRFIRQSGLATGMLFVPRFLKAFEHFGTIASDQVLVVLQLSGGNDGLNTIVPFGDDLYYQHRPQLGIARNEVISLDGHLGLHPKLQPLKPLYDNGDLCIIKNVGYPNPDRSHFRSMDIWHTASGSHEYLRSGWLGRYLDSNGPECELPYHAIEADDTLSLALKGVNRNGMAIRNIQELHRLTQEPFFKEMVKAGDAAPANSTLGYLYKTMTDTYSSADYIFEKNKTVTATGDYPNTELGKHLKQIATWMRSGLSTQVYYASLGGFDTHVNQKNKQAELLNTYSTALAAFAADLKQQGLWNKTLVMTFSEFGRRVEQNASGGTDHGTASSVILASGALQKKGFYNGPPALNQLYEGDLRYEVDFREIYATVLKKWLNADDSSILMRKFNALDFI